MSTSFEVAWSRVYAAEAAHIIKCYCSTSLNWSCAHQVDRQNASVLVEEMFEVVLRRVKSDWPH
jgi:hypothetical protein